MQPATLNGLLSATQTELPLPERARELLSRPTILVRAIDRGSLGALHPMLPESVIEASAANAKLPAEERDRLFNQLVREWQRQAPEEERVAYRLGVERVKFRAIALAALDPRLTWQEAERLGDDAEAIYLGLLEFSGLLGKGVTKDSADTKAPADAAVGA